MGRLEVQALGDLVGHLLDAHAEPAATGFAELAQLIDDRDRGLGRHREADADRAARRRDDRGVDADDIALEIEQRAAGIAAIDGGVGLDVVVVGTGLDVAVARRHDAGGDGAAEAERIADRDHPFAEPQPVGIAERNRGERLLRLHPQQREVDLGIATEDFRLEARAVIEDDGHLVGVGDDVVVGHHDAGGIDDEARSQRIHPARRVRPPLVVALLIVAAVLEEVIEELAERRTRRQLRHRIVAVVDGLRGRDVDDRIDDLFGDIGDVVRTARRCRRGDKRDSHHRRGKRKGGRAARLANEERKADHGR